MAMSRRVSIAEAKNNLPALVHEAERRPIDITRRGERVAVLMSADEFDRLTKTKGSLWRAIEQFRDTHDLEALDLADPFKATRDRSIGRRFQW